MRSGILTKHVSLVYLGLAACLFASTSMAQVTQGIVIVNDASDIPSPSSCTLRNAINLVNGNTPTGACIATGISGPTPPQIKFSLATPATIVLGSSLVPRTDVAIIGPGRDLLTISGNDSVRIFGTLSSSGAELLLEDLTLAHGQAPSGYAGGAIDNCCGHAVTLQRVNLHDNHSDFAGGAISSATDITISDSSLYNNSVAKASGIYLVMGGAIYHQFGTAALDRVVLRENTAGSVSSGSEPGYGGAIAIKDGASMSITDSTIADNHALALAQHTGSNPRPNGLGGQGGGLFVGGTLVLERSTISGNNASFQGGGLFNIADSTLINATLANNRISGSTAPVQGGGIFNAAGNGFGYGVKLGLTNTTVFANSAGNGGGLYNARVTASDTELANSAFGDSGSGQAGGDIVNASGAALNGQSTLVESGSSAGGLADGVNGNIVGVPAGFLGLGNNGGPTATVRFTMSSPLLDTGDNALAVDNKGQPLTSDQRDLAPTIPRKYNGVTDIGAFEFANDLIFANGFD